MTLRTKRVYEDPATDDGTRVLVDRIWPRGLTKEGARVDEWMKEIAPSTALRKWFDHDPRKWHEFQERYRKELETHASHVARLRELHEAGRVTLLYAAKDQAHNNAVALQSYLEQPFG